MMRLGAMEADYDNTQQGGSAAAPASLRHDGDGPMQRGDGVFFLMLGGVAAVEIGALFVWLFAS